MVKNWEFNKEENVMQILNKNYKNKKISLLSKYFNIDTEIRNQNFKFKHMMKKSLFGQTNKKLKSQTINYIKIIRKPIFQMIVNKSTNLLDKFHLNKKKHNPKVSLKKRKKRRMMKKRKWMKRRNKNKRVIINEKYQQLLNIKVQMKRTINNRIKK